MKNKIANKSNMSFRRSRATEKSYNSKTLSFTQRLLLILFIGLLISNVLYTQTAKENEFKILQSKIEQKENELHSLTKELKTKADEISFKKADPNFDKEEVKNLLANSAELTNSIEKIQKEIYDLNTRNELVKSELYIHYSNKIDSLENSKLSQDEKSSRITKLIEKRLFVSPRIDVLSFEPEKVLNVKTSAKPSEKKLYNEFLISAFDEIELKLKETKELKVEIETIQKLNKETKAFLEEAEFDREISYFSSSGSSVEAAADSRTPTTEFSNISENSIKTQTVSFNKILNQLNFSGNVKMREYSLNQIVKNNDLDEFKKLITQVEQQLEDYKVVVKNKIQNQ
ncbi:MAG: hypothetical protein H6609_02175 [Ignavibacteriales bacterium]|nr:hypothetical protein [Ignavibacteriales bacterium]